ncbi:biotin synthase BioB [Flammeovirga kamogawensis]|uniref:Biotin synthase n=1 Tax=Flammeovirga kamogawensis TaxID=373891 RepID=A0ABX8GW89_9BACT|nr:biotin synthase BioB [Flammeovirga kamogawensis]MBB6461012.1 biotin synthase [Flammeovirga kamogawensis]QWG07583.1 biotin synthase BioB [Flammeovirga kamogawensis]TRX69395.1 biotin synthase BioB [Flammeovirga kamogawensis]
MQAIIKNDWTRAEVADIYNMPLMELMYKAATIHREFQKTGEVQVCTLLSVKTGGCKEDCSYCSQSSRYSTHVKPHKLMATEDVIEKAKQAKDNGSTRFCMGAAWREARSNKDFERVLGMVGEINDMGMEVCATLGMLSEEQAEQLKNAGLYAYNHNLDTSREYYDKVITTRTFDDRLDTIKNVQKAKISVCSGGIIGLGETDADRIGMLHTLASLPTHPESVPVNALVPVEGTPMEQNKMVSTWEMIRMIATARIIMPEAMVRLSAGRTEMSTEAQALCFMAGANSIFAGDQLLTTPNPEEDIDKLMFDLLGLTPRASFKKETELV